MEELENPSNPWKCSNAQKYCILLLYMLYHMWSDNFIRGSSDFDIDLYPHHSIFALDKMSNEDLVLSRHGVSGMC